MNGMAPHLRLSYAAEVTQDARFDQGIFLMHLNRGRKLVKAERLHEARAELEQALDLRPRDEVTLNLLGMIYFRLDMRPQAAAVYRSLLEMHPEADVLHSNLGVLEFKDARYDDARRRLETALLLNPKNARPHLYLGLIDRVQGNLAACLEHLEAAGATELLERLRGVHRRSGDDERGDGSSDADTGPMRMIEQEAPAAPDLGGALDDVGLPSAREGREATFTVHRCVFGSQTETLEISFQREIRVRAGTALDLIASAGALHVAPPDAGGMMALKGTGRVALGPPGGVPGRILLIELAAGRRMQATPGRLLAHENGVIAALEGEAFDRPSAPVRIPAGAVRLSGEGLVALWAGPTARAVVLAAGELLLVRARDLVCWTESLRARPDSPPGLERLLAAGEDGAVTLEGGGEVVIDAPAR